MKLDLLNKEIADRFVRENFFRLKRDLEGQVILDGYWQFYEVEFSSSGNSQRVKHNLSFTPQDIIFLSVEGDHNIYFNFEQFDSTYIYISVAGPCRVRFLAGAYRDKAYGGGSKEYTHVPPSAGASGVTSVTSTSPGLSVTNPSGPNVILTLSTGSLSVPRLTQVFDCAAPTAVGDLVVVTGTNFVATIADNAAGTMPNGIFGVAYSKPSSVTVEVIFSGIISGYSGFTAGSPLFVQTSGVPGHTVPTTGMVQQIGFAVTTGSFFLSMMQALRRS